MISRTQNKKNPHLLQKFKRILCTAFCIAFDTQKMRNNNIIFNEK